jgi:hypothetical protein
MTELDLTVPSASFRSSGGRVPCMTSMPITPGLALTLTQALRRVLFASQNDESSGIFARQPDSYRSLSAPRNDISLLATHPAA